MYKSLYLREETSIKGLNREGEYLILAIITLGIRYRKTASIAVYIYYVIISIRNLLI